MKLFHKRALNTYEHIARFENLLFKCRRKFLAGSPYSDKCPLTLSYVSTRDSVTCQCHVA